jgi:hypothetical protein
MRRRKEKIRCQFRKLCYIDSLLKTPLGFRVVITVTDAFMYLGTRSMSPPHRTSLPIQPQARHAESAYLDR